MSAVDNDGSPEETKLKIQEGVQPGEQEVMPHVRGLWSKQSEACALVNNISAICSLYIKPLRIDGCSNIATISQSEKTLLQNAAPIQKPL